MIVLLPPSEGKTAPADGPPVEFAALSHPELTAKRERLLGALVKLSAGPQKKALRALEISERQAGELARNAALREAPAGPAAAVYTGVLYERLRLPELPNHDRVLIASALWGVVAPGDGIPAYRLAIGARVPRIGPLAAYWRPALRRALPDDGLVVDLRSGGYAAAWAPKRAAVVAVRAFTPDGHAVSHMVKATRGDVARVLLLAPGVPETPQDVADVVAAAGLDAALHETRAGWSLDVTVRG